MYKVATGWLLGYVFLSYYQQGDTLHYFADAQQLTQLAYQRPVDYLRVLVGTAEPPARLVYLHQPRALFMVKLVSLVNIITHNNYWITSAYFSLASFASSWLLANDLSRRFPQHRYAAAVAFLCYPSVVFWGAGVLKESVAVAAIMLIVLLSLRLLTRDYPQKIVVMMWLLLGGTAWLLWRIKYYYAGVLLPTLVSAAVAQLIGEKKKAFTLPTFVLSWLLLVGLVSLSDNHLRLTRLTELLVYNHDMIVRLSKPTNIIHFWALDATYVSFLKNLPLALVSGLFRPLAWEANTWLQGVVGLENTALLLLAVGALINSRKSASSTDTLWILATVVYIVLLASVLAFASPNFGSLMRYKVSFLPFLVFLCVAGNPWLRSR